MSIWIISLPFPLVWLSACLHIYLSHCLSVCLSIPVAWQQRDGYLIWSSWKGFHQGHRKLINWHLQRTCASNIWPNWMTISPEDRARVGGQMNWEDNVLRSSGDGEKFYEFSMWEAFYQKCTNNKFNKQFFLRPIHLPWLTPWLEGFPSPSHLLQCRNFQLIFMNTWWSKVAAGQVANSYSDTSHNARSINENLSSYNHPPTISSCDIWKWGYGCGVASVLVEKKVYAHDEWYNENM